MHEVLSQSPWDELLGPLIGPVAPVVTSSGQSVVEACSPRSVKLEHPGQSQISLSQWLSPSVMAHARGPALWPAVGPFFLPAARHQLVAASPESLD